MEWDGRLCSGLNGSDEFFPLIAMSLVLTQDRARDRFRTIADKFEAAKIFEGRDPASTKDFDAFLGIRLIAIGEVGDGSLGAIREAQ